MEHSAVSGEVLVEHWSFEELDRRAAVIFVVDQEHVSRLDVAVHQLLVVQRLAGARDALEDVPHFELSHIFFGVVSGESLSSVELFSETSRVVLVEDEVFVVLGTPLALGNLLDFEQFAEVRIFDLLSHSHGLVEPEAVAGVLF